MHACLALIIRCSSQLQSLIQNQDMPMHSRQSPSLQLDARPIMGCMSRSTRGPLGPKVEQAAARIPSQPQTHMVTAHPGFSHPSYSMNMPAGLCTMLQVLSARSPGRCVSGNEMRRFRNSRRVFETFGWLKCFWDKKLKLSEEGSKSPRRGVKNQTSEKSETRRKNYQKTIEFGRTKL